MRMLKPQPPPQPTPRQTPPVASIVIRMAPSAAFAARTFSPVSASDTSAKSSLPSFPQLPVTPKTSPPTCCPNPPTSLTASTSRNSSRASSFRSPGPRFASPRCRPRLPHQPTAPFPSRHGPGIGGVRTNHLRPPAPQARLKETQWKRASPCLQGFPKRYDHIMRSARASSHIPNVGAWGAA
jgi:hypothetical protein